MNQKITVIDSIMGSGKTTWIINHMKKNPQKRFLYIAPLKSEDERIKKEIPDIYVPPDEENKPKLPRVKNQLRKKRSIASTHSLFQLFDEECISLIREGNYILIMDEVIEVLNPIEIKRSDIDIIMDSGAAIVDDDYRMVWTDRYKNLSENGYGWLEHMIKLNKVINVDNEALMWQFPPEIFDAFHEIFVLTYLFEANIMHNYFLANNLRYAKKSIENSKLVEFKKPDLSRYQDLINIYEGKLNTNIHSDRNTFSFSWYDDADKIYIDRMKNNLYNWFHNISQSKSKDSMWTTFKEYRQNLQGKGYTKGFVHLGCRATNNYANKSSLAYCVNRFHRPMIKKYFSHMGYPVNESSYALSDLIQWIWRSRIRNGQLIDVYLPSPRMRNLLVDWLTNM